MYLSLSERAAVNRHGPLQSSGYYQGIYSLYGHLIGLQPIPAAQVNVKRAPHVAVLTGRQWKQVEGKSHLADLRQQHPEVFA